MCRLICVTSSALCGDDFVSRVSKISKSEVDYIILREKQLSGREYEALAEKILTACGENYNKIILHTHFGAAQKLGCKKIHLPLSILKDFDSFDKFNYIGTSVHSAKEAALAQRLGASCVAAGHIFKTDCKRGLEPRGTRFLKEICESTSLPVFAIGGINTHTIKELGNFKSDGFGGVCVMSELMKTESPEKTARLLKASMRNF